LAEELRRPIKSIFQDVLRGHDVLEVACGTGYWTEVIAESARSVLATDVDPAMISLARRRLTSVGNVRCQVADAYTLEGVEGVFNAAFSHWWWSHIPKSCLRAFLGVIHGRLVPGALVVFADQLPYQWGHRRVDEDGNLLEQRVLPDGSTWEIVKNFPTEQEIAQELAGLAGPVHYAAHPGAGYWTVIYNTIGNRQSAA
jgi:SAM-dependent methyltransferase